MDGEDMKHVTCSECGRTYWKSKSRGVESVYEGKVYQGIGNVFRKVEKISGTKRKVIIFQEINEDGSETHRCHYRGYKEFCRWAKREVKEI